MPGRRLDLKTESNFYNIMYDVCCICTLTYMYSPHTIEKIIIHQKADPKFRKNRKLANIRSRCFNNSLVLAFLLDKYFEECCLVSALNMETALSYIIDAR